MPMIIEPAGKEIQRARLELGLSVPEFTALLGVARSTYYRWIAGDFEPEPPTVSLIRLLVWLHRRGLLEPCIKELRRLPK